MLFHGVLKIFYFRRSRFRQKILPKNSKSDKTNSFKILTKKADLLVT